MSSNARGDLVRERFGMHLNAYTCVTWPQPTKSRTAPPEKELAALFLDKRRANDDRCNHDDAANSRERVGLMISVKAENCIQVEHTFWPKRPKARA
jgi:hypothetical protein